VATDAGVSKYLSLHRIRHSSMTTFLDASGGCVDGAAVELAFTVGYVDDL
jgi:hypothetical protein